MEDYTVAFAAENVTELAIVQFVGRVFANDDNGRRRYGLLLALLAEGGVRRGVPAVEEAEAGREETARAKVLLAAPHVFPCASESTTLNAFDFYTYSQGAQVTWYRIGLGFFIEVGLNYAFQVKRAPCVGYDAYLTQISRAENACWNRIVNSYHAIIGINIS